MQNKKMLKVGDCVKLIQVDGSCPPQYSIGTIIGEIRTYYGVLLYIKWQKKEFQKYNTIGYYSYRFEKISKDPEKVCKKLGMDCR